MKVSGIKKLKAFKSWNSETGKVKKIKKVSIKPKEKKIHLGKSDIEKRIEEIKKEISLCVGKEGKGKRKRLYYRLKQLDQASKNESLIVDPNLKKKKINLDKKKRIEKKLTNAQITAENERKQKNLICHLCKKRGHLMTECRLKEETKAGKLISNEVVCFKCGSSDHSLLGCNSTNEGMPFATCFCCQKKGHITRDCPDNELGWYRKGGCCHICSSVRHFAKDCPEKLKRQDDDINYKRNKNRELMPEFNEE